MEIIIKTKADVITPTQFANQIASKGMPIGKTFWCSFGSIDCIKCICLSHGHSIEKGYLSVENKYQQFTVK